MTRQMRSAWGTGYPQFRRLLEMEQDRPWPRQAKDTLLCDVLMWRRVGLVVGQCTVQRLGLNLIGTLGGLNIYRPRWSEDGGIWTSAVSLQTLSFLLHLGGQRACCQPMRRGARRYARFDSILGRSIEGEHSAPSVSCFAVWLLALAESSMCVSPFRNLK